MGNGLYVLYLSFTLDLEYVKREFLRISRISGKWARPVMHGRKTAGLVIATNESLEEFTKRLRPSLDEISVLDNYWVSPAPILIEGKYGSVDPFRNRLIEGWTRVRQGRLG
jgi:hypothetical protein